MCPFAVIRGFLDQEIRQYLQLYEELRTKLENAAFNCDAHCETLIAMNNE